MKNISREAIQRMTGNGSSGGGGGGGSVDIDLSGYATMNWTEEYYINKEFFSSLFKAYDANGDEVLPNDTETTIDNIKAMFGFWTDFYISALGNGGQQSVDLRLAQLADVNVAGVTNGQVLTYDSTTGKWIASTPQSGTDMATVWANLAASGNQQIDASHLSTALTGYATQTWVGQQGYITSSALTGYATKTWVGQQGYITSSGNAASATKLKNARTIWGQSFDGTANVSGALSGATTITASSDITTSGDLNGNGGVVKIEKQSGEPQLRFHTPEVAWGNIRLNSSSQFCFYQAYESSSYAALNTGSLGVHGYIAITNGQRIHQTEESGSILYIGSSNNYGWVRIQDVCSQDGNAGDDYWSIRTSGAAAFTSVYSKTYVTALSDARHKDVIGDTGLTVEDIAKAPAIRFQWNDRDDKTVFAGSIAQYWQKILPEVVQSQADDTLSLDYQVAALISSITVARKVVDHESRLQRLEKMFAINEDDIED